jgi:hypothetical protein
VSRNIFEITEGQLAFAIVDKAAVGYTEAWQAPAGKDLTNVTLADYDANSQSWSCQTTAGALNATADTTTKDVAATFCEPAETIPSPGKSTYELAVTFLQDPNVKNGLNRFLFTNDVAEAYFLLGLNGGDPPRAIGRVRLSSATIGGEARSTLTADITLPLSRRPDIDFGDANDHEIVEGGEVTLATNRAAAKNGDVFAADTDITGSDATNAAKLTAEGFVASPATAWTGNQFIQIGSWKFYWNSTAWKPGDARRAAAAPGNTFESDPDITASDSTNAAKLAGEGFVALPLTAWTTGQQILVGSYAFNWTSSAWAAGAHA